MKKYILSLVLILFTGQFAFAQDLHRLMADLAKTEKAQHNVVDRSILAISMQQGASNMPSFMEKLESIEVVNLGECSAIVKGQAAKEFEGFKDGNGYETLLRVKDGKENVRIVSKKNEDVISDVFFLVINEEDVVLVKMTGQLDAGDLEDIMKEQNKNK